MIVLCKYCKTAKVKPPFRSTMVVAGVCGRCAEIKLKEMKYEGIGAPRYRDDQSKLNAIFRRCG